jgi:hypothetical protein
MRFTSDRHLDDGVFEREFILGEIPGILWTPGSAPTPVPLILLGHPGGLHKMYPRLVARAQRCAADGFASATIELPGSGDRPRLAVVEQARADLRRALAANECIQDELIDQLILPLVKKAVPEWRTVLDALLGLHDIDGPVGYSGGLISIGIRLAAVEPRIVAAGLFAGSLVPRALLDEARQVTIPVHVLLQWDDEGNDRQRALDVFDAFSSKEKSLHANMGGHTGVPQSAGEAVAGFFARHLNQGKEEAPTTAQPDQSQSSSGGDTAAQVREDPNCSTVNRTRQMRSPRQAPQRDPRELVGRTENLTLAVHATGH